MDAAMTTLTLSTNDVTLASATPYSLTFTVSLFNYPAITLTKTFQVTIICKVLTLTFLTPPSDRTLTANITP